MAKRSAERVIDDYIERFISPKDRRLIGKERCARTFTTVEIVKGHASIQREHRAKICTERGGRTRAVAVVCVPDERPGCFVLPFGKRSDPNAWAVPARRR